PAAAARARRAQGHDRVRHLPGASGARLRAEVRAARRDAGERALVPRPRAGALMARTVLITGGSGYFGSVLADQALARGERVRIFDLTPPGEEKADVEFVQGDVRDREAVAR